MGFGKPRAALRLCGEKPRNTCRGIKEAQPYSGDSWNSTETHQETAAHTDPRCRKEAEPRFSSEEARFPGQYSDGCWDSFPPSALQP